MTQLGIGTMLHMLAGGSKEDPAKYIGRKIAGAALADNKLNITFDDGVKISLWDDGQSCCESRYMTTDDDVATLVGGKLVGVSTKDGPRAEDPEGYGDEHETCFVEVQTDQGFITVVTHNEHNGYYGGFGLTITEGENA